MVKAGQLVNYKWFTKEKMLNVSRKVESHVIGHVSNHVIS